MGAQSALADARQDDIGAEGRSVSSAPKAARGAQCNSVQTEFAICYLESDEQARPFEAPRPVSRDSGTTVTGQREKRDALKCAPCEVGSRVFVRSDEFVLMRRGDLDRARRLAARCEHGSAETAAGRVVPRSDPIFASVAVVVQPWNVGGLP